MFRGRQEEKKRGRGEREREGEGVRERAAQKTYKRARKKGSEFRELLVWSLSSFAACLPSLNHKSTY